MDHDWFLPCAVYGLGMLGKLGVLDFLDGNVIAH